MIRHAAGLPRFMWDIALSQTRQLFRRMAKTHNISACYAYGTGVAGNRPNLVTRGKACSMIHLTESAVNAVRTAIAGAGQPLEGLRIAVDAGGCAGFKYMMGLVAQAEPEDAVVESDGVKVFVDVNIGVSVFVNAPTRHAETHVGLMQCMQSRRTKTVSSL